LTAVSAFVSASFLLHQPVPISASKKMAGKGCQLCLPIKPVQELYYAQAENAHGKNDKTGNDRL
jgi:hypothetical protein